MNFRSRSPQPHARALSLVLLCLIAFAITSPQPAFAGTLKVCQHCLDAGNDTTSTPGKTAIGELITGQALNPAVAFIGTDQLLRCAVPQSPGWQIELVDPFIAAGGVSLVLDAQSEPMLAYHDANGGVWFAHRVNGSWQREVVDASAGALGATTIARVPGGVGVAYTVGTSGALKYAEHIDSQPWSVEFVTPATEPAAYPSLAVDGTTRALAYYDPTNGDLRFASRLVGSTWSSSLVDSSGDVGGFASLVRAPGSQGTGNGFGIACYDFGNADLKYAYPIATGWAVETVDGAGAAVGRACSAVAFGSTPDDHVGIGYYDRTHGDLKYALKQGAAWTVSTQDTAGDVGDWLACGATPSPLDTVGIAYVDRDNGDLLYQWHAGTVTAVAPSTPRATPLHVEWLSSSAGAAGRIRFALNTAGPVRVTVYDAAGRVVAVPLRQWLPAGTAEVGWDGRDQRGALVGSGLLFVRVETPGGAGSAAAVVIR